MRKLIILVIILVFSIALSMINGPAGMTLSRPILELRFLRILMAIVAGSGLAVCGIVLQAILRNPLAEPYLLGTSSGAGLGAVVAIILDLSGLYFPLAAFCGAILSIILVYNLASQNNKIAGQSLILSGVIVSVALSAVIVFLMSISSKKALYSMTWWLWGNLQVYDAKLLLAVSLAVFAGVAVIYVFSQDLNAISLGEEEAMHLGINAEVVKKILILVTSLLTASLVCICGIIGFVGLIVPHMMRMIFGPNHKMLIPVTAIGAAVFMVVSDLVSRTLFSPIEIPIGVITAIIGAPIFIILLKRKQGI